MAKIVVKIGGSVAFDEKGPRIDYIRGIIPILKEVKKENQLIVAIGGGKFVKNYEKAALKLLPRSKVEESDIALLKANVVLFSHLLDLEPIYSLEDVNENTAGVVAGIVPGRSTDANAVICAKTISSDLFIKLTNTDGIYDKDPNKFKNAKFIDKIKFDELESILKKEDSSDYKMLDATAIRTVIENKIKTIITNGNDPNNILKAINKERVGTLISD